MAGESRQIDAISVGVGLNLSNVRGEVLRLQGEIRRATQGNQAQSVEIPISIHAPTSEITKLRKTVARDLAQGGAIPVAIKLGDLRINQQDFRNFRRTIERQLRGFSQNGQQGIHVPIQVSNLNAVRTQIENYFKN